MNDELLPEFYAMSRRLARRFVPPDVDRFDDLIQEGAIAAWKANQKPRADAVSFGVRAARNRMLNLTRGDPMLGSERPNGGRSHDQFARRRANRDFEYDSAVEATPARDTLCAVEQRIDLDDAMSYLNSRDRTITALVGAGMRWNETGAQVGMSSHAAKKRWHSVVKPQLRRHLEEGS